MIRRAVAVLLLIAFAACRRDIAPPARPQTQTAPAPEQMQEPRFDDDRGNLLNIAFGASVVFRTAEMTLDNSAAHAIDGINATRWVSPPAGPNQTLVYSLGAPARVTRLGVLVQANAPNDVPKRVRFALSQDGKTWNDALVLEPRATADVQLGAITPATARYVRVDTDSPGAFYSALTAVQVIGEELRGHAHPSATGCWTINSAPAELVQQGARVVGVIRTNPPTLIDGGTDGRVIRAMWIRGTTYGYVAMTLAPDASAITGITFYEIPSVKTQGEAWLGERCSQALQPLAAPIGALLARAKKWELYGLAFDAGDRIDPAASAPTLEAVTALLARSPSQRFRIVAHELREGDAEQNRRHSVARIESLRAALQARGVDLAHVELVAAGSDWSGPALTSAVQRVLASSVTIEPVH